MGEEEVLILGCIIGALLTIIWTYLLIAYIMEAI